MQNAHLTWEQFMGLGRQMTPPEHLLVQAIAKLTTEPAHRFKTPEEVYGELVEQDRAVRRTEP